jgi:hypothetical protein
MILWCFRWEFLQGDWFCSEGALEEVFGRFGAVLAVTLRVRRDVKAGRPQGATDRGFRGLT